MSRRRWLVAAWLTGAACSPRPTSHAPVAPPTLARHGDPIVLTGAQLPWVGQVRPEHVTAWAWRPGWTQIAVQIDERTTRPFVEIYDGHVSGKTTALVYADPHTFTGADDDPSLDADDELVLRAEDVGSRAPDDVPRPRHTRRDGVQVRVSSPLDGTHGHVYLFLQDGTLDPHAGLSDVRYTFRPVGSDGAPIDYRTRYDTRAGKATGPRRNPEDSWVETPHYRRHWSFRNAVDRLELLDGTGVNLVERHDFWVQPGDCARHVGTFDAGKGAFIANRAGPVRAIRSYLGANSAPLAQTDIFYYAAREDTVQRVRAHARDHGGIFYTDHTEAARGMTWSSDTLPEGVVVDGVADVVPETTMRWSMLTGEPGTTFVSYRVDASFELPEGLPKTWFVDAQAPQLASCLACSEDCEAPQAMHDGALLGAFGPWLDAAMPNTDPRKAPTVPDLTLTAIRYVAGPGATREDAESWDARARHPLWTVVTPHPPLKP